MINFIKKKLHENLIREFYKESFEEKIIYMPYELFMDIKQQRPIKFNVIPKTQYHNALKEFMQYGEFMRFPEKYIMEWKDLLLENIAKLNALTEIHGHSSSFPYDEFYDVFDYNEKTGNSGGGEFSRWLKKKQKEKNGDRYERNNFYTVYKFLSTVYNIDDMTPQFSNGHYVLSDYAVEPLLKLGVELASQNNPNEIIITINKILDVAHQRSDIAEIFIEGGSKALSYISNS